MRRREPDDVLARAAQSPQHRQHELQLADAFAVGEELGQLAGRPAIPRKLGIQGVKPGWRSRKALHQSGAAPDRLALQDVFQLHTVIIYSIRRCGVSSAFRPAG